MLVFHSHPIRDIVVIGISVTMECKEAMKDAFLPSSPCTLGPSPCSSLRVINNAVEAHCYVNDIKWGHLWSEQLSTITLIRMFWWRPTWPKHPDLIYIVLRCLLCKWLHLISFTQQWASTILSAILLLAMCSDIPSLSLWFCPAPFPPVLH